MTVTARKPPIEPLAPLARPVSSLFGVGPERAAQLARVGVSTVEDLLLHRPRRYEDRRHFRPIAELQLDEPAITRGTVVAQGVKWFRRREKSVFELILDDGTARLHCRWWNLPFMENYFAVGNEVVVFGRPNLLKPRTMDHPETEVVEAGEENFIHLNRITPIYPLTEGLPQRWLRSLIWRTVAKESVEWREENSSKGGLSRFEPPNQRGRATGPPLPGGEGRGEGERSLVQAEVLPSRTRAIRLIHFPDELEDIEAARRRLALDELVVMQRQIQLRRRNFETKSEAFPCGGNNRLMKPFLAQLGFKLTDAQTKVLRELRKDLSGPHPMRRLLQGDVGSGKTAVAACCALMALESGYNVALMVPTEILAEQHFRNFTKWFRPLGVGVELRTGSVKTVQSPESRVQSHPESRSQKPVPLTTHHSPLTTLFIGTHALLTPGFELPNLGLVIIDEQHRFGVAQREHLVRKGRYPHLLVMTATPIPRTLGLTVYGELDVSVIEGLPPGRGRIKTFVRAASDLPKVWTFIREKLAEGRQAYVVYPRVEESGLNGIKAVTKEFATLQKALAPFRVEMVHGRLKSDEKEAVMASFRAGTVHVLLATSLIEVGVDVPNATIMLIESAELFGLAQLHQLRGRIGRGPQESFCILVAAAKSKEARQRLAVLEETTDGFRIAEADLKLRGPGEMLGQQQSGAAKFRFANLSGDWDLIQEARRIVQKT